MGVLTLDCVRKKFSGFSGFSGFCGFKGFKGVGAKMMKRRSILIALRAYRHFERSPQSLLQNAHHLMGGSTRTSFFLGAYTLILAVQ